MNQLSRVTLDLARSLLGDAPSKRQQHVVDQIEARRPISQDAGELATRQDSFWDRLADAVARIGGSWPFIGVFFLFLLGWTGVNSVVLAKGSAFDPYPYIFLNLMLSMLAAIQAPIIMMSQNRAAQRDRKAAEHDYLVNLRAELEIMHLHDKVDALREQELLDIIRQQAEALALLRADRAPS
ncbi:DUF1003 domain-containing protein [Phenylobacterium sp.]|uniref:DUF1003 domain-containing protein n=1 Tax=Phenylobacterium sp. TaxID=1871053 RepID=UPI00301BE0CC